MFLLDLFILIIAITFSEQVANFIVSLLLSFVIRETTVCEC